MNTVKLSNAQIKILHTLRMRGGKMSVEQLSDTLGYPIHYSVMLLPLKRAGYIQLSGIDVMINDGEVLPEIKEPKAKIYTKKRGRPIKQDSYIVTDIQHRLIMGMLRVGATIYADDYYVFACHSEWQLHCVMRKLMSMYPEIKKLPKHKYQGMDNYRIMIGYVIEK